MTNIHDVIKAFINGDGDKIKTENVFIETGDDMRIIFSYGHHFPLCVITKDGKALLNISKYSVSTSKQQNYLRDGLNCFNGEVIKLPTEEIKKFINSLCKTYLEFTESKI